MDSIAGTRELSLHDIGLRQKTDKAFLHKYLSFYETHLSRHRHERIRLLEIGIGGKMHSRANSNNGGSSLRMWEEYFPNAEIYGVDIDKSCLDYSYKTGRVKTMIGDQTDRNFLNSIPGEFDVIIDDGGHFMNQQMISFGCLFGKLRPGGVFIIEDLHTSLIPSYGGNRDNVSTPLSSLHSLKTSGKINSKFLLPHEKELIEKNTEEVFIHGFYSDPVNTNSITSVIRKSNPNPTPIQPIQPIQPIKDAAARIQVHQIYYDDETRGKLDGAFIPYHNKAKDNFFENTPILDLYEKGPELGEYDFIGVTSPRFRQKTGMDGASIMKMAEANRDRDVVIYSPCFHPRATDIWKLYGAPKSPYASIRMAAEVLNKKKYLPFDIFERHWTYCLCNYWIARKRVFEDYVSKVLKPTIEIMKTDGFKKEISGFSTYSHRGAYPVEPFVLEGLFGSYLSNNGYNVYNHFAK